MVSAFLQLLLMLKPQQLAMQDVTPSTTMYMPASCASSCTRLKINPGASAAAGAAAAACQVVVRTASRSYRVSQMASLLRDAGDTLLVSSSGCASTLATKREMFFGVCHGLEL
jgi:hypothetical protein